MLIGKGKIRPSALLNKNNGGEKNIVEVQQTVTSKLNAGERSE